ncbi:MAG: transglycosylase SLT domain-containing protein [Burkholderiales bacterium]|nr:transglycosylase SLT domain-containing protein [Burkholderiales bacterium]
MPPVSLRLLTACVVLGAFNQACAVGTPSRAVAPAVPVAAQLPARDLSFVADLDTGRIPALKTAAADDVLAATRTDVPMPLRRAPAPPVPPAPRIDTADVAASEATLQALTGSASAPVAAAPGGAAPGVISADPTAAIPPAPAARSPADGFASLWDRIRAGFAMNEVDSPLVQRHVAWYLNRPGYVQRMVERSRRYLHFVVGELEKRDMPLEIALLPMIESAYNPSAYSPAHAAGMWQFIPTTGKRYGLEQNWWYDGRRDVMAATRAALDYLQKLHGDFGDWQLALAAYNWGEGAVARAIERNQRAGLPTDYASLRMPVETRNYLPKLQAVKELVAEPDRYGLVLEEVPNQPYFTRVALPAHMDQKRAAQLANLPLDEFRSLNPAHNRPVIPGGEGSGLLLPVENAEIFAANLESNAMPLVTWTTYRMQPRETLEQVATRFGIGVATLRQVNSIGPRKRVKGGSTVLVPTVRPGSAADDDALDDFQPPSVEDVSPYRTHRVRRGESLRSVAAQYDLSAADLARWNHIKGDRVKPGQRIVLHPRAPHHAHHPHASAAKHDRIDAPRATTGSRAGQRSKDGASHVARTGSKPSARPAKSVRKPATTGTAKSARAKKAAARVARN